MKKTLLILLIVLLFAAPSSAKFKIYLKTGKVIKVDNYRKVDGQIIFPMMGGTVGISEDDIERIEDVGKGPVTPGRDEIKQEAVQGPTEAPKTEELSKSAKTQEAGDSRPIVPKMPEGAGDAMTGRLYYDGQALSELTKAEPKVSVYSTSQKKWISVQSVYDEDTGRFTIYGLDKDDYSASIHVDANFSNPRDYPGDYSGNGRFRITGGTLPELEVHLKRIIHLTGPQDNGKVMEKWGAECGAKPEFKSPVKFSWDSMGSDVIYTYSVTRTICKPFEWKDTVAGDTTESTEVLLDLPPNSEGEIYTFRLDARKRGRAVGMLMTHGSNGYGWDYRFRVAN